MGSVGTLVVRSRSDQRIELRLSRATSWAGWALVFVGAAILLGLPESPPWLLAASIVATGLLVATLEKTLIFDRTDGVMRSRTRFVGIPSHSTVPLFHLRAVVVASRPGHGATPGEYVAYVERRIGAPIVLGEARRSAGLVKMAQAVAEVAGLHFVYDNTGHPDPGPRTHSA
jgi:hypothetical protein